LTGAAAVIAARAGLARNFRNELSRKMDGEIVGLSQNG
jgi:hypothetical protein